VNTPQQIAQDVFANDRRLALHNAQWVEEMIVAGIEADRAQRADLPQTESTDEQTRLDITRTLLYPTASSLTQAVPPHTTTEADYGRPTSCWSTSTSSRRRPRETRYRPGRPARRPDSRSA
jgi:hypothetical protein